MKKLILMAALAASFLASACTVVREHDVETRPGATVIQRY